MTKRDSQIAELSSPRVLRTASHDVDMPMALVTAYTAPPLDSPLPSSSTPSTSTGTPLFQAPTTLQLGEYRQKNVHTTIFKIFEYGDGPAQLHIEEIDANGYTKKKTLETYFFGIIGHLRDSQGEPLNTRELCQQLANYWREWFGIHAQSAVFPDYIVPDQAQGHPPGFDMSSAKRHPVTSRTGVPYHAIGLVTSQSTHCLES